MDQSKWSLPRNRIVQSSKEASSVVRPRMKLHGVWVHGIAFNLYVCHPGVPADSSLIAECFLRAMEDTARIFEQHNKSLPKECCIWVSRLLFVLLFLVTVVRADISWYNV